MSYIVQRRKSDGVSTLGQLWINGAPECYTLEPPNPIPAGTYDLAITFSPRFARLMPHVENVPGHEGILIHWGNWAKDTEDCLLVGIVIGKDFIGQSKTEFDTLFLKINDDLNDGPLTITYFDPPEATT